MHLISDILNPVTLNNIYIDHIIYDVSQVDKMLRQKSVNHENVVDVVTK